MSLWDKITGGDRRVLFHLTIDRDMALRKFMGQPSEEDGGASNSAIVKAAIAGFMRIMDHYQFSSQEELHDFLGNYIIIEEVDDSED